MKFLILGLLGVSSLSFAQTQRNIFDVMYLPQGGTFYGSTEAAYAYGQSTLHSDEMGDVADFELNGYAVQQTVGYGMTSKFFATATISYEVGELRVDPKGGESYTQKSKGESDPSLNAKYRLVESDYLLDVLAGAVISTGESKLATEDKDGNIKQGGASYSLGLQLGQKIADIQHAFSFIVTHYVKAEEDGVKLNAHNAYDFRFDFMNPLFQKTFLRSYISMGLNEGFNDENGTRLEQATRLGLGSEFQYLCSENLLMRMGLSYLNVENQVYDGLETRDDYQLQLLMGANYQF
jgi:hypothetical protein